MITYNGNDHKKISCYGEWEHQRKQDYPRNIHLIPDYVSQGFSWVASLLSLRKDILPSWSWLKTTYSPFPRAWRFIYITRKSKNTLSESHVEAAMQYVLISFYFRWKIATNWPSKYLYFTQGPLNICMHWRTHLQRLSKTIRFDFLAVKPLFGVCDEKSLTPNFIHFWNPRTEVSSDVTQCTQMK